MTPRPMLSGQMVEVRTAQEILATLDPDGCFDGMPFMPEMAAFVGRPMKVFRRADTTCVEGFGLRKLNDTVLLESARCDGAAHDGCQRNCLMFWKEAWLRPEDEPLLLVNELDEGRARRRLLSIATRRGDRYTCQSTALANATAHLPRWNLAHLLDDVRNGQLTWSGLASMSARALVNRVRRLVGVPDIAVLVGDDGKQKAGSLNLRPGDWVRIKPPETIRATLGPDSKNRGLSFEPEMTGHAGALHQVDFRVEKIILEETGKMARLKDTVALRDVVCQGLCAKNCPRANTLYWREGWLERVPMEMAAE